MEPISVFLIVLYFVLSLSCIQENVKPKRFDSKTKGVIYITKTTQGFNIYSNKGELILEYTKQNCDSLSLMTLADIYETSVEFYNKERFEESINNTQIRNINMSENNPIITNQELLISNMLEIQALIRILTRKGITDEDEILSEVKKLQKELDQKIKDISKLN